MLDSIERKTAASGMVDYAKPVIIHETGRSRVDLVPFFINHSDRSGLSIKLQSLKKATPPLQWAEVEEKSLSLDENATLALASALERLLAITGQNGVGSFIALRVDGGEVDFGAYDPEEAAKALIGALSDEGIASHLAGVPLGPRIVQALKYSVRLEEMKQAMSELRALLDSGAVVESKFQHWCEEHPWALGNQFVVTDEVRNITTEDQVDLLVPRINAGFRDIIELKRPDMDVLHYDKTHRDWYFSHETAMAIGQCHRYLDVFYDAASRGLLGHEDIVAYHPVATIVIGRSKGWAEDKVKALHGLNSRLSDIRVVTYDYLLAQGDSLVDYLSSELEDQ